MSHSINFPEFEASDVPEKYRFSGNQDVSLDDYHDINNEVTDTRKPTPVLINGVKAYAVLELVKCVGCGLHGDKDGARKPVFHTFDCKVTSACDNIIFIPATKQHTDEYVVKFVEQQLRGVKS